MTAPAVDITPAAATALAYLARLRGGVYREWHQEVDGRLCVTLRRSSGKFVWFFGATLEEAALRARADVETAIARAVTGRVDRAA